MPQSVPVSTLMVHRHEWPQFRAATKIKDVIKILRILSENDKLLHGHDTPLVLDDSYKLLGYIRLTDLLRSVRHLCNDSSELCELGKAVNPVEELVIPFPATVSPQDSILHALDIMTNNGISLLPVTLKDKLVGLIKLSDIFNIVAHLLFDKDQEEGDGWFERWLH